MGRSKSVGEGERCYSTTLKPYMIYTSVASCVTCWLHVAGPLLHLYTMTHIYVCAYIHTYIEQSCFEYDYG